MFDEPVEGACRQRGEQIDYTEKPEEPEEGEGQRIVR